MIRSLRTRIAIGLAGYSLLLAVVLIGSAYTVHESLEWMVWHAQLDSEMSLYLQELAERPDAQRPRRGKLTTYVEGSDRIPEVLRKLTPGLHDEIEVEGRQTAIMVGEVGGKRVYMQMDISTLEDEEDDIARAVFALIVLSASVLVFSLWWLSGRLIRPVSTMAIEVDRLQPGAVRAQRLQVDKSAATEVETIANAMNRLLDRVDEMIQRERAFVETVSHELRTPLAVIGGAAQIAVAHENLPESLRKPLQRIEDSADEVGELIHLLLMLAKSPERLRESDEEFQLGDLLPEVIADHRHLIRDKDLTLDLGAIESGRLHAPPGIVQIAIANLLRNAIEHSDRGTIRIWVAPAGVVNIEDGGHGMSPEEISRLYATLARRGERQAGQGIGLALIARICDHLSWKLDLASTGVGTLARLDLRTSLIESAGA